MGFNDSSVCELWVAPSTIPGAGVGLFAGRDFALNEKIHDGELVVPMVDHHQHQRMTDVTEGDFWIDEYTWEGATLDMGHEGHWAVSGFCPGFGALTNAMNPIANAEMAWVTQDEAGLHRSRDPGAGAFTSYSNRSTWARAPIQAGQEFFLSYGDGYFLARRDKLGHVPLYEDLKSATTLAHEFGKLECGERVSRDLLGDVWKISVSETPFSNSGALHALDLNKTTSLVGEDSCSLLDSLIAGDTTMDAIHIKSSTRSLEWLEQYGNCVDQIQPGRSTLPQAGHGGFAKRFLRSNSVVVPLPLIPVLDRSVFEMYRWPSGSRFDSEEYSLPQKRLGLLGYMLLLNYCFGHAKSTLLLCPYGPTTGFVNHNQTMANVKLRWASDSSPLNHHPELLQESVESLVSRFGTTRVAMELVATRDIQPGEELFLDYGNDWEAAWQHHLKSWRPPLNSHYYRSAFQLNNPPPNADNEEQYRLPTVFELMKSDTVDVWCNASLLDEMNDSFKCDILRYRQEDDGGRFLYTAVMHGDDIQYKGTLKDAPREAFSFYDKPYTSDMHVKTAFRHDIRIPNEMFPEAWHNK